MLLEYSLMTPHARTVSLYHMLRTYILAPRINPVVTAFLLFVGYWLFRSILVISLWTHLIREVGSMDQAQQHRGPHPTDGKLAGIPEKMSCWLMFGRV